MVQTNKILTVSYGTFSCTLEGFDDSFGTMKAIAEYFRDLAADDRYFGAEPPQPDAEMLARIAQKEIARQVEAHQDGNGFLLRAAAPALQSAAPRPAEPEAAEAARQDEDPEPEAAPAPILPEIPDPALADEIAEPAAPKAPPSDAPAKTVDAMPEPVSQDQHAAGAETDNVVEILEPQAPASAPLAAPPLAQGESMADKLARIRAVVERNDTVVEDQIEDIEEAVIAVEPGEAVFANAPDAPALEDPVSEQFASDTDEDSGQYAEDPIEEAAEDEPDDRLSATIQAIENLAEAKAASPASVPATADDDTEFLIGAVMAAAETEDSAPQDAKAEAAGLEDTAAGEYDENDDDSLFLGLMDEDEGDDDEDDNILSDAEPRTLAHALKVKRADIEQAIADNAFEEIDDATAAASHIAPNSTLSVEDEADLQSELDAVAAELAEAQAALNPPDEMEDQTVVVSRSRAGRGDAIKGSEPPVTRLLKETEGKMEEPESASSREAYDHLRAAVVATRAEAEAPGENAPKALTDAAYRDDLANVVRPRRPDSGGVPRSRRPDESRPAPLKLVAEQRIDADSILPQRGPVRPRRVAAEADEATDDSQKKPSGFAAFAREAGATELPELLEAAASYMSFVEGWDQFSRPQLMTRVKQVENSGFNREDGLRTFGQLLREGKIEKTSGGRFTASERIGFRPARKAVG